MGFGGNTRESERVLYSYAEKTPEEGIRIQALNANSMTSGERTTVEEPEFLEKYKPEPLIYSNTVKPRLGEMLASLDKAEKHLEAGLRDLALNPGFLLAGKLRQAARKKLAKAPPAPAAPPAEDGKTPPTAAT